MVLAATTPADCFGMVFEAVRLATKYMTPVILLVGQLPGQQCRAVAGAEPADPPDLRLAEALDRDTFAPYRGVPKPWPGRGPFRECRD